MNQVLISELMVRQAMADAIAIPNLTHLQEKPLFLSSAIRCPHNLLPRANLKPNRQFQQAQFGSLSTHSSPPPFKSVAWHRLGERAGRASPERFHASSHATTHAGGEIDSPPSSKEETVQQAGESLLLLLENTLKQQGPSTVKRRKSQRQVRLRVDIPLLEDSPQALVTLTEDLLDSFLGGGKTIPGKVAVYFSNSSLLDGIGLSASVTYHSLEGAEELPRGAVVALVIAPRFQQAGSLDSVVRSAGVRPVIVVNPEWSEEEEGDKSLGAFLTSFCVAYSFIPLNIQGFFSKTEGAVLKRARSGAPEGQPWLIFVKEGDNYKCVSRLKKRPTPTDLENALYSSMAANSPVNKSISFLRGLVSK